MSILPFPQPENGHAVKPRSKLGELLCTHHGLTPDQLRLALQEQKAKHDLLGRTLVKLRLCNETTILAALATQSGCPLFNLGHL